MSGQHHFYEMGEKRAIRRSVASPAAGFGGPTGRAAAVRPPRKNMRGARLMQCGGGAFCGQDILHSTIPGADSRNRLRWWGPQRPAGKGSLAGRLEGLKGGTRSDPGDGVWGSSGGQ